MSKGSCAHTKATFYAVQKYGQTKSIKLYNCPECRSTISEETLRQSRRKTAVAAY